MRTALLFTPHASPTYPPLGVALLAGLARERAQGGEVVPLDLNLTSWEWCAGRVEGGAACLAFFRGRAGEFFDEEEYAASQRVLAAVEGRLNTLDSTARRHLAGARADAELAALLERMCVEVEGLRPDLVGFSLFSLGQFPWVAALARLLKARGGPAIVVGGAAVTALDWTELLAACPFIDGVVPGEGDEPFLALASGEPLHRIPGLFTREGGVPVPAPFHPRRSADPDFSGFDLTRYLNPVPVLPVLASRGCKWGRCRFCAHNSTYPGGYRPVGGEETAAQLARLSEKYGARHFYLADLYLDAPELEELSAALAARGLDLAFHVLGRPTSTMTPELMGRAARAGLRWISWGIESASPKLLKAAGKGTRARNVERALRAAHSAGISNLAMMIYGLPTSTDGDLEETFAFLERVYPLVDAMTASPFALFANSPFGEEPGRWSLLAGEPQVELTVDGAPIHSRRLGFSEIGQGGEPRPPRGEMEAARWTARRRWLGEPPFLEGLPCEHYLLYSDRRYSIRMASTGSSLEARQEG